MSLYSFTHNLYECHVAKVIAILSTKGGCGKSTLATNLARALQIVGASVLIADSDPQGTARAWRRVNQNDELVGVVGIDRPTLEKDIPSISHAFDYIIIDGAAKLQEMLASALKISDVVLIPVQPSAADIWGCSELVELIKTRQQVTSKPKAAFIISRQIVGTRLAADIAEALQEFGMHIFDSRTSQRVVYVEALSRGSTVIDLEPRGLAASEVFSITDELRRFIDEK